MVNINFWSIKTHSDLCKVLQLVIINNKPRSICTTKCGCEIGKKIFATLKQSSTSIKLEIQHTVISIYGMLAPFSIEFLNLV